MCPRGKGLCYEVFELFRGAVIPHVERRYHRGSVIPILSWRLRCSREGVFGALVFLWSGTTVLWLPVVPHDGMTACVLYGNSRGGVFGDFGFSPSGGSTAVF